mmetsp:Transcript_129654/g.415838  ORF Transcript_129654/g.415838 Transcript_129654/m.415838 type:complete len:269 (-) Transcript_129654:246-1052(-)
MPFTWCTGMAASRLPVTSLSAFCSTPVSGSSPSVCRWHSSRHCRPACRPPLWQSPPQAFWRHWCLGSRSTLWTTPCCWSSLHGWRPRDPPSLRRAPTTPPPHSSRRPACPPSSLPAAPRPRAASGKRRRCHCRRCLRSGRQLRTLRRRERRRQGQTSRAEAAKRIAPQCMLLTKSIWQMQVPAPQRQRQKRQRQRLPGVRPPPRPRRRSRSAVGWGLRRQRGTQLALPAPWLRISRSTELRAFHASSASLARSCGLRCELCAVQYSGD